MNTEITEFSSQPMPEGTPFELHINPTPGTDPENPEYSLQYRGNIMEAIERLSDLMRHDQLMTGIFIGAVAGFLHSKGKLVLCETLLSVLENEDPEINASESAV